MYHLGHTRKYNITKNHLYTTLAGQTKPLKGLQFAHQWFTSTTFDWNESIWMLRILLIRKKWVWSGQRIPNGMWTQLLLNIQDLWKYRSHFCWYRSSSPVRPQLYSGTTPWFELLLWWSSSIRSSWRQAAGFMFDHGTTLSQQVHLLMMVGVQQCTAGHDSFWPWSHTPN